MACTLGVRVQAIKSLDSSKSTIKWELEIDVWLVMDWH